MLPAVHLELHGPSQLLLALTPPQELLFLGLILIKERL